jgi:hypothetical protein
MDHAFAAVVELDVAGRAPGDRERLADTLGDAAP